ncbi:BRCA2-interacting transcriptional repressor EMSY-like [Haliotis rubra]|uniref:BRCA2-interacting transcriptional repressor EMSY-like n=1 Tax=Haliotis rubra TaxID=36100 RepID=UPI001EE50392|nr:BRCA2-interacting transcriptional repressor EMSY-like [Haliotis rubra]
MWPMLLDLSRDESKRILRRLELEAYSSLISAFRAQGDLNKEKKSMLQELQHILSISTERHRAEVRRAVNDEKLATIADNIAGSNTTTEWVIEGRRLIPLMPRLVPQTAFTVTANQVANAQSEKNASLPYPSQTGSKDSNGNLNNSATASTNTPVSTKLSRPSSPTSNVVVLPSGTSIHIKGVVNSEEEDELQTRKRRRSQSSEGMSSSVATQTPRLTYTTTASNSLPSMSPVKITISKSPQGRTMVSTPGSQPPKVILVTSSGQSVASSVLQKSMSVPIIRASTSSSTVSACRASIIVPGSPPITMSSGYGSNIVTVSTTSITTASSHTSTTPTSVMGNPTVTVPNPALAKPRPKIIPRPRFPNPQHKPGVVIPMGPQPVQPSPQNYQVKTVTKPTIQIKQEGGMKIITQSLPPGTSKILPKPAQLSGSSGTPVVVVNAGPSGTATTTVTMVTKPVTTLSASHTGGKVLNITTPGGRVIATTTKASNVVTVNPKTLHLTAVKTATGTTVSKPNVIVVQKTQPRRSQTPTPQGGAGRPQATVISSPAMFEKELVNFIQKQELGKQVSVSVTSASALHSIGPVLGRLPERKVIITTATTGEGGRQAAPILHRSKSDQEGRTSSLLAELIQAAGIVPDGGGGEGVATQAAVGGNEWFEYDIADDQVQTETTPDSQAISALMQMQGNTEGKHKDDEERAAASNLEQITEQMSGTQYYTIEQAMSLLNQVDKDGNTTTTTTTTTSEDGNTTYVSVPVSPPSEVSRQPTGQPQVIHIVKPSSGSSTAKITKITSDQIPPMIVRHTLSSSSGTSGNTEVLQGELDPETGLFYKDRNKVVTVVTQPSKPVTVESVGSVPESVGSVPQDTEVSQNYDLLSSTLSQAHIDLGDIQFINDGAVTVQPVGKVIEGDNSELAAGESVVHIEGAEVSRYEEKKAQRYSQSLHPLPGDDISQVTVPNTLSSSSAKVKVGSSSIPLQDVGKATSTMNIVTQHAQSSTGLSLLDKVGAEEVIASSSNVSVAVEPSPSTLDELTSQRLEEKELASSSQGSEERVELLFDSVGVIEEEIPTLASPPTGSGSDSQGEYAVYPDTGTASSDPNSLFRSKRKRKPPAAADESTPSSPSNSWIRMALGLLQRVSRYRGVNREKGELNASAWFTQPVDPADAPDYYSIVKKPMDFGTIRKKLESGGYKDHEEFHQDMTLVKENCAVYNPPTSRVFRDCTEVFTFYTQESEKLADKWHKGQVSSPPLKKIRIDKSPGKS